MDPRLTWTAACVGLALLAWGSWSYYAVWVELRRLRVLATLESPLAAQVRGLRQQVANVITMLRIAGFKMRRSNTGWDEADHDTIARGELSHTKFDWRTPG